MKLFMMYPIIFSNLSLGIPIVVLFEVIPDNISVRISALNLINEDGLLLESLSNITDLGSNRYGAAFSPPSETFQLQVLGIDHNGYNFLRTNDGSIMVTKVSLILSKLILKCVFRQANILIFKIILNMYVNITIIYM